MCGIFASILPGANQPLMPPPCVCKLLKNRGPNLHNHIIRQNETHILYFEAHVLWMQGKEVTQQPIVDHCGNILLWNGDIFNKTSFSDSVSEEKSDTAILSSLLSACAEIEDILKLLRSIHGPWSFIYWNEIRAELWFGRDALGRHSLLLSRRNKKFVISSVLCKCCFDDCVELPAEGIFKIDHNNDITMYPWSSVKNETIIDGDWIVSNHIINSPYKECDISIPTSTDPFLSLLKTVNLNNLYDILLEDAEILQRVQYFNKLLEEAVSIRCTTQPQLCQSCTGLKSCNHSSVAVLFSGGLDSAVISLIADSCTPAHQSIDLINVAFVQKETGVNVPDRITGQQTYRELCDLKPNRTWNFVQVNVTKEELADCRNKRIKHLIHPLKSVLDDSLGCALWFAARGQGYVNSHLYTSPARVLLLGMGADELLGGYAKCRKFFSRSEDWFSLAKALKGYVLSLPTRNLGRDDRVVCDSGRQARFPFLDENVVNFLVSLPAHLRTAPLPKLPVGVGEKILLRLMAFMLGLKSAASAPKRALQFGSKIAGLEGKNERGDDICDRLG